MNVPWGDSYDTSAELLDLATNLGIPPCNGGIVSGSSYGVPQFYPPFTCTLERTHAHVMCMCMHMRSEKGSFGLRSQRTYMRLLCCAGLVVTAAVPVVLTDKAALMAAPTTHAHSFHNLPADGGTYNGLSGFVPFNWAKPGAAFPAGADPFGELPGGGGCMSVDSDLCRGRIPTGVSPTHLLVKKHSGEWALWAFDGSAKANTFLQMAQAHQPACSKASDGAWTPIASSGNGWGCGTSCNVLAYTDGTATNECTPISGYATNGWNYILDDDGHWCNAAFKMGATLNSQIPDDFGFLNAGCGTKVGGTMLYRVATGPRCEPWCEQHPYPWATKCALAARPPTHTHTGAHTDAITTHLNSPPPTSPPP